MVRRVVFCLLILVIGAAWLGQTAIGGGRSAHKLTEPLVPGMLLKVEPSLLKQVLTSKPGDHHRCLVELTDQSDLATLPEGLTRKERQRQVVARLQTTAQQAQADLLAFLQAKQSEGQVQHIHPFWIFNGVALTADAETLLALAARPEVRIIRQDRWHRWVEPRSGEESLSQTEDSGLQWNITQIGADLTWNSLGLNGDGITVGIMDTGVDWQHPALQLQYRGYKPGGLSIHEGNWFCATDEGYLYPYDGYGHGTHVTGTAVGRQDADGVAIGVAPGAQWIAVKALSDAGYGYDSWIHAAFEWLMAPAGDPTLSPDVVNSSWGSPFGENEVFRPDVQALRAAGIVPVFSTGNDGPYPGTVGSPGSYPEAIAVGATDELDQVTSFSSRGPSPWGEIKPEVSAPGVQIRSSLPGGTYGSAKGTSMAAPHVTGLVALMLQADPTLSVDSIEAILTSTALALGSPTPNNDTGWGRIDAYRAAAVALQAGYVSGQVTRQPDLQPLPYALVTAFDHEGQPQGQVTVDQDGHYELALPEGTYNIEATAFGYEPERVNNVSVVAGDSVTADLALSIAPAGVLWGQITDAESGGPLGVQVSVMGTPALTVSDPQTGQYSLPLPAGTYTVTASQNGYRRATAPPLSIAVDEATRQDFSLTPAPTLLLVDSGRWYYGSQASYFQTALEDRDYVYDLWEIRGLDTDIPEEADLALFDITIWSAPFDSPGLIGAGDTISNYLGTGGHLFLTGQDIGYWDDGLSGELWHEYYSRYLRAKVVTDDAGRGDLVGLPQELLHGLSLPMNGPNSANNQLFPDAITLLDARDAAIIGGYAADGDAALRASGCQSYKAIYLAAGLEGLGDRSSRAEVMDRALSWLGTPHPAVGVELHPPRQDEVWLTGTSITYTVELRNTGQGDDRFALELSPSEWNATVWDETFSQPVTQSVTIGACQTQTLRVRVAVPPDIAWNLTDVVTLTARSLSDPAHITQATFHSRAPAPLLLVDDHRWYDVLNDYQAALDAYHVPYDVWKTEQPEHPKGFSPSLRRLARYPVVIWFTAYDWYSTLTLDDEARLAAYLNLGGRLLLSSQEYLYTSGFSEFGNHYLGVADYTESLTATRVMGAVGNPVGDQLDALDLTYPFPNWSDALRPDLAALPAFWGQHGQPVALTLENSPWKTEFFAFPLEALADQDMATVIKRAVDWLSPLGDSSLTVDRPVVSEGGQLTCTILIRNTGPAYLRSVSLFSTVPVSTTYVPGSLEGPGQYDHDANAFTWSDSLDPDQAVTIRYRLQLAPYLSDGMAIQHAAHLTDESGLTLDLVTTSRVDSPDLSASVKQVNAERALPGEILTYTLALHNNGLRPALAHLLDPIPPFTTHPPDSGWASTGLLTSTSEALLWSGSIPTGQAVTITFPVVISPSAAGLCIHNRAILDDQWGNPLPLEACTWVQARVHLPLILK